MNLCQFIDQHYGEKKLSELLYAYKDGLQTEEAIESVLDIAVAQFDREFAAFVVSEHGVILDNLEEWHTTQVEISQLIDAADWQGTIEAANRLVDRLPLYTEPDSPYLALTRAEDELGNVDAATAALEKFWRNGGYDPDSLKELGRRFREDGRTDDAIAVLMSSNLVDPFDEELHGMLGELLLDRDRAEEALQEFTVALALSIRILKASFQEIDVRYEQVARFLGCTPMKAFFKVTLPLARQEVIAAYILAWARAVGEFGATVMLAGAVQGETETIPIAIYMRLASVDVKGAVALIMLLSGLSLSVLVGVRIIGAKR